MTTTLAPPLPAAATRARVRATAVAEFLLVGGATPLVFALSWWLRRAVGLGAADLAFGFTFFYAAHLVNDPHFSVTYLLFYEDAVARVRARETPPWQRARYVLAGLVAPVVLVAWALVGF